MSGVCLSHVLSNKARNYAGYREGGQPGVRMVDISKLRLTQPQVVPELGKNVEAHTMYVLFSTKQILSPEYCLKYL